MKRITTLLLILSAFIGSAQSLTFQQSFPEERISVRITQDYDNWQYRISEISNKGGLMLGGVGYHINGMLNFTPAVDIIAFTNGADIRFETMVGRKFKSSENQIVFFGQYLLGQKNLSYGFGVIIPIPQ